jgi:hypothetical protein
MSTFAYNPDLQTKDELITGFVARQALLARLLEDLQGAQPQHHLIIGQRGMGKTTLLRRLALEVDRTLGDRWLALTFPEEQYNIGRLSDLWLNCLDALADALERAGQREDAVALDTFLSALPEEEGARASAALERLLTFTRERRGLVLCIDNVDQVFGRLKHDHWAIREVLDGEHRLVFVGAAVSEVETAFDYGAAFYDFFQVHWLQGLSLEETRTVVHALAERDGDVRVLESLEKRPARLGAMQVLTGGNPRTVVLLYQVLARDPEADIRGQLEALLDQVTPLYKARFEALSDQTQMVLDALATAWDPRPAADVAAAARLETTSVSTHLHRLHQAGVVEKVDLPGASRIGFQVAERFFNVWYLMRASRRQRQRLLSLARCLEALYGLDELESLARSVMNVPSEADFCLALAQSLHGGSTSRALTMVALDAGNIADLRKLLGPDDGPVLELAERKERAQRRLALASGFDFEALGIDREWGELAFVVAHSETSETELAAVADALREYSCFFHPSSWDALRRAYRAGDLEELPTGCPEEVEAVAVRYGWPLLATEVALLRVISDASVGLPPEVVESALASEDERVGYLLVCALYKVDRREVALAARVMERWPDLLSACEYCALSSIEEGPTRLSDPAVTRALELGTQVPAILFVGVAKEIVQDLPRTSVERLLASTTKDAALWTAALSDLLAEFYPTEALRFWHRTATLADPLDHFDALVKLLAGLRRAGCFADAMALVDTPDLRERARPLYAAMTAIAAENPEQLRAFAPEVAEPARLLLDALWPVADRPAPPPRKGKRRG